MKKRCCKKRIKNIFCNFCRFWLILSLKFSLQKTLQFSITYLRICISRVLTLQTLTNHYSQVVACQIPNMHFVDVRSFFDNFPTLTPLFVSLITTSGPSEQLFRLEFERDRSPHFASQSCRRAQRSVDCRRLKMVRMLV